MFLLYEFFIEHFSGEHIFYLYLQKSEFSFQYVNWTTAPGCEKVAKKDMGVLCYES